MSDKRVSTDGLTRCTRCRRHIQAGESPSTTACPFCDRKTPVSRRGALLAGSLFAMACGGATPPAEEPVNPPVEQPADEQPVDEQPVDEPPAETEPETEPEPETDPEVATPEDPEPEDDSFERPVERPGVVALYGIAPRK